MVTPTASNPAAPASRFGEPGAADLQVSEFGDRRAEHASEGRVAAGDVGAGDAALLVGVRAEGDHDRPPGDAMVGLHAVAGGPDVRRTGAQVVVDDDATGLAHADARGASQV